MPRTRECDYCEADIEPGTGTMFVRTDGTTIHYCSSKCEKNASLGREARDLEWTGEEPETEAEPEGADTEEAEPEEVETDEEADEAEPDDTESASESEDVESEDTEDADVEAEVDAESEDAEESDDADEAEEAEA